MIAGAAQDYERFYQQEIQFREQLQYPPFARFLKLTFSGVDESRTMKLAEDTMLLLQGLLAQAMPAIEILGPYAAPVAKIGDLFRVQLLLRGENLSPARQALVDGGIAATAAIAIDVDPLGMM